MCTDPQEDFEAAQASDDYPGGIVGTAILVVAAGALMVIEAGRGVAERGRGVCARLRRWPLPATLGALTNDEIDRLPAQPGRS